MCDQKSYEAKPDSKETPKPTLMDDLAAFKKKFGDLAKEAKIKETQGVKRKPLSDGTLPLTESEKAEIAKIMCLGVSHRIVYLGKELLQYLSPYHKPLVVTNIEVIDYLLKRFQLTDEV